MLSRQSPPLRRLPWLVCVGIAGLCGCSLKEWVHNGFKVGPEYRPPVERVASAWIDYSDARVNSTRADLAAWWKAFNDPVLNGLVESAYLQNLSLREAGMRIEEARYRRQIVVGNLFPQQQEAIGSYSRNKISGNTALFGPQLWFSHWETGFHATWELDFWGRFRRAVEAADAELDASVENYDDVLVLLLAEVAAAYTELRTFQQRLEYAHNNVTSQEKALEITEDKLKNGVATERDVQQARTILEGTRALIPTFEAGARLANNRLCVLLGTPARDLVPALGAAPIPAAAPEVAVGIPADLVRRRPDVRRAERELAAQSARIGIAESDLYPHIGLGGTIGVAAEDFNDLFGGSRSMIGGIGPFFQWNVLNYGRIVGNIGVQDARFGQLLWAYLQRVLEAGREAEDGIVTYLRSQERVRSLAASAQAAERTLAITTEQYRQGVVDFTAVFIASSELAARQDNLAEAEGARALSLIALYRALGGGWELRLLPAGEATGAQARAADARTAEPLIVPPAPAFE